MTAQRGLEQREVNEVALRDAAAAAIRRSANRCDRLDGIIVVAAAERHDRGDHRFRERELLGSAAPTQHRVAFEPPRQPARARVLLRRGERDHCVQEVERAIAEDTLAQP